MNKGVAMLKYILKIGCVMCLSAQVNSQELQGSESLAMRIQGYYSSSSANCTKNSKVRGRFVSCKKESKDCLLIKKITETTASVEIYSTQAGQHLCAVNGTANIANGKMFLDVENQRINFQINGNYVELKQSVPPGEPIENCGAHAKFDGLKFKKVDTNVSKYSCFEG